MSKARELKKTNNKSNTGEDCTLRLAKESSGIGEAVNDNAWLADMVHLNANKTNMPTSICVSAVITQQTRLSLGVVPANTVYACPATLSARLNNIA